MPVTYKYYKDQRIVDTDAHGDVHVSEIVDYLERLLLDDEIIQGSIEIFSLENATDLDVRYDNIQMFKEIWARYKVKVGNTVLVIAPTEIAFGLFRMLGSVVEASDPESYNPFKIMTSRQEVMQYIENNLPI